MQVQIYEKNLQQDNNIKYNFEKIDILNCCRVQLQGVLNRFSMSRFCPIKVDGLYDAEGYFWSSKQADTRYCTQIAPEKYLWTSMDNRNKLRCMRFLFDKCDIAESELVMLLEPIKE